LLMRAEYSGVPRVGRQRCTSQPQCPPSAEAPAGHQARKRTKAARTLIARLLLGHPAHAAGKQHDNGVVQNPFVELSGCLDSRGQGAPTLILQLDQFTLPHTRSPLAYRVEFMLNAGVSDCLINAGGLGAPRGFLDVQLGALRHAGCFGRSCSRGATKQCLRLRCRPGRVVVPAGEVSYAVHTNLRSRRPMVLS
ncbi:MAG: hypothetical protein K0S98_2658, partial [Propionibacteriaceae bacterium]|nr:hypothetical protein [Propionibacteriaceae bacterium]